MHNTELNNIYKIKHNYNQVITSHVDTLGGVSHVSIVFVARRRLCHVWVSLNVHVSFGCGCLSLPVQNQQDQEGRDHFRYHVIKKPEKRKFVLRHVTRIVPSIDDRAQNQQIGALTEHGERDANYKPSEAAHLAQHAQSHEL